MFRQFIRKISLSAVQQKSVRPPIPVFGVEGRYVQALYSAAAQTKQLDDVEACLKDLQKVLTKPKVVDFIETSLLKRSAKSKLLKEIAVSAGLPSTASNFLALLAENGRLKSLKKIIQMFLAVMTAHRQEAECEVITASPLEESDRAALLAVIRKFLPEGKKIHLNERISEDVLGGLVVGIEDKHVDLCIYRKILMYTELIKKSV